MSNIRVLIADDNAAIREIVRSKLSKTFDDITAVADGGEAIAAVATLHPDLAILDISMPVLNGVEVARQIRKVSHKTSVVFLTACNDPDVLNEAAETRPSECVLKSRLWSDLIPAIESALKSRAALV